MRLSCALIREALTIARDDLAVPPLVQPVHAWATRSNVIAPLVPNRLSYFCRFRLKQISQKTKNAYRRVFSDK